MRRRHWYIALVVVALLGLAQIGWTQEAVRLTIHSVTSEPQANGDVVLVITGIGFGETPEVTVDGQSVPVLEGASDTRVTVMVPTVLLTTPGTYRLTVVDPTRKLGDAFIVAALPGTTVVAGAPPTVVQGTAAATGARGGALTASGGAPIVNAGGGAGTGLLEDTGSPYRTAIGYQALYSNSADGYYNTASGWQALYSNTTGDGNTAHGWWGLYHNGTGYGNTATGAATLTLNTDGHDNTATGFSALQSNELGNDNTASGSWALYLNKGSENTAVGYRAGFQATTGSWNVYFGSQVEGVAGESNTIRIGSVYNGAANPPSGQNQTFIAGIRGTSVSSAMPVVVDANGQLGTVDYYTNNNTAYGSSTLPMNTTGADNVATGYRALYSNTTGASNTATGSEALTRNTEGIGNVATGYQALQGNTAGTYNVATGYRTLFANATGSFNVAAGDQALYANTTGARNVAMGHAAMYANITGSDNVATGYQALHANTTGNYNTASGASALYANTTGTYNTASGFEALTANTTGAYNTASGTWALHANTTGDANTASGYLALYANSMGAYNTASGYAALRANTTGDANAASGYRALWSNTTGGQNTASGFEALRDNTTGNDNTALGYAAGYYATTGHYNLFLGANVHGAASDTNTIRIGSAYNGAATPPTGQNQTFIAGIRGTSVSSAMPVVIDANGQLGTADNSGNFGIGTATPILPLQVIGAIGSYATPTGTGFLMKGGAANVTPEIYSDYLSGSEVGLHLTTYSGRGTAKGLTLQPNGYVGIGTVTPLLPLQVIGAIGSYATPTGTGFLLTGGAPNETPEIYSDYLSGSEVGLHLTTYSGRGTAKGITLTPDGFVGIGVMAPSQPLQLASGAYASAGGAWVNASSRALKDQIVPLSGGDALRAVEALAPVTFVYKAEPTARHVGFIAEDVPALVATPDRKSLSTMDVVAVLTKAVQELRAQKDAEIAALQARLARLEALVAAGTSGSVK
jgi:hypothetical protein